MENSNFQNKLCQFLLKKTIILKKSFSNQYFYDFVQLLFYTLNKQENKQKIVNYYLFSGALTCPYFLWDFVSFSCKGIALFALSWSQSSLPFVTSPISNVDIFQLEQFRDNAFECLKLYAFYTSKYSVFCVDCYDVLFQYFVLVSFSSPNNNSPFLKEKLLGQLFVKKNKMSSISHFIPFNHKKKGENMNSNFSSKRTGLKLNKSNFFPQRSTTFEIKLYFDKK
ncbi:hypothetical protein RFI_30258 [Reticulomyxa filosa]|uniref:Uncharacterized protein n=1 Tax=Reticulomyxa filosa TaxID=46433 RepID=X6M2D1_RETFI|nr:hypothetical protein RFI_30258 [Reticulomyxa filosa]|eukprot:ETO07135.1 hypothetical protein RFI_30258 [Reticulomyxa filosa]